MELVLKEYLKEISILQANYTVRLTQMNNMHPEKDMI